MSIAVRKAVLGRLGTMRYEAEAGRDLRFDFLRGFCVFAMVVDHLAGPSGLYLLTGGNRFYTSAAEGFVFISGLMVGLAYRRMAERDGLGTALRRMVERSWQLYALAVASTLLMVPVSELLDLPWARGVNLGNPLELVVSIVTLHQTYYLVDIPLLYALLLLVAPIAFVMLYEGRSWVVLVASWTLWAAHQVFPEQTDFPWPIAGNYLFYFSAWQVLFFTAMVMGYHHRRIQEAFPRSYRMPLLIATGTCFLLLLLLFRYTDPVLRALSSAQDPAVVAGQSRAAMLVDLLFAKGFVRPGRIFASAVVFTFVFLVTSALWTPLRRLLGWLLLPLGQHALFAYTAHIVIAVAFGIFTVWARLPATGWPGYNAAVQLASIGIIWVAVRYLGSFPSPRAKRWWTLSPAVVAAVLLVVLPFDPSPDLPGLEPSVPQSITAQARAARVFGTPVPRTGSQEGARPALPPAPGSRSQGAPPVPVVPLPPPAAPIPGPLPGGEPQASSYVGLIRGSFRELEFASRSLERDMRYFIYLPPRYKTSGRRYPVLYMLHGGSGDKEEWVAYGLIDAIDNLITSREIRPMIVVLPQGDWGYWVNHVDGGPRWGDYVARDLVRHIDSSFRTLPDRAHRAIGGLSMGAHGALQLAFTHPRTFGNVGAHSPSLRPDGGELPFLGTGAEFAERDPISLARTAPGIEDLNIWIDIGDEDPWLEYAELLHEALVERGVGHEWNVLPGEHGGEYWERNLVTYLRFYDRVLNWRWDRSDAAGP